MTIHQKHPTEHNEDQALPTHTASGSWPSHLPASTELHQLSTSQSLSMTEELYKRRCQLNLSTDHNGNDAMFKVIHLSVEDIVIRASSCTNLNSHKAVPTKEYKVSIEVLGPHEFTTSGLLQIKKAYLRIMIKSFLDTNIARTMNNIQTQPWKRFASPNNIKLIEFKVPLPECHLFCLSLAVILFYQVFVGLNEPKLVKFTFPFCEIMYNNQNCEEFTLKNANYMSEKV